MYHLFAIVSCFFSMTRTRTTNGIWKACQDDVAVQHQAGDLGQDSRGPRTSDQDFDSKYGKYVDSLLFSPCVPPQPNDLSLFVAAGTSSCLDQSSETNTSLSCT